MTRIAVFCGSNLGAPGCYEVAAHSLGTALADAGVGMVYGGGAVGLMGVAADACLAAGGEVIGVIPNDLFRREVAHRGLSDLRVVDSMHERKAIMSELADGFVALPGGFGTFEELFEQLTWLQLGLIRKPVVVYDVDGFYRPLVELVERACRSGFIRNEHVGLLRVAATAPDALRFALEPVGPVLEKWNR